MATNRIPVGRISAAVFLMLTGCVSQQLVIENAATHTRQQVFSTSEEPKVIVYPGSGSVGGSVVKVLKLPERTTFVTEVFAKNFDQPTEVVIAGDSNDPEPRTRNDVVQQICRNSSLALRNLPPGTYVVELWSGKKLRDTQTLSIKGATDMPSAAARSPVAPEVVFRSGPDNQIPAFRTLATTAAIGGDAAPAPILPPSDPRVMRGRAIREFIAEYLKTARGVVAHFGTVEDVRIIRSTLQHADKPSSSWSGDCQFDVRGSEHSEKVMVFWQKPDGAPIHIVRIEGTAGDVIPL